MAVVPARMVVRPPNWLGDAVMALPALAAVRQHFADAHLTVAAVPAVAALFREDTDVRPDDVIDLPGARRDQVRLLADGHFDLGLLLPNSWRSAWQFRRAGIAERWGYRASGRGLLLTRAVRRPRGLVHQADYYRHLVRELGIACDEAGPRLAPREASLREADRLLARGDSARAARLVGIAPGAAYGQAKQWPPDRVAAVVARLVATREAACVLVGAGHDRDAGRAVESWLRAHAPAASGRVVNLIGQTSLRALTGVLSRTDAVLANDSGAMHLAAALGRPVVAVFGPTDDRVTRPIGDHHVLTASVFCRPCMLRDCPIDHRCMTRIGVDAVFDALDDALGSREAR
ncbi:MAG: lipopolysaccharide heptosyltransferase II [Acidobacteria bacterium SCN 69-37]|nr:MAG: lipopolysaccharide heptosyltransferase II [Acidobacteria bacterium SCN 69-37]